MIRVVSYDPGWPADFEAEAARLSKALGDSEACMDGKDAFVKHHQARALIWQRRATSTTAARP